MTNRRFLLIATVTVLLLSGSGRAGARPPGTAAALPDVYVYVEPNGWQTLLDPADSGVQAGSRADAQLSLGFCPDYDVAYHAYAQDWFAAVYPAMVAVLGEPYSGDRACLCPRNYAGWPPECKFIIVGSYPDIALPYDPNGATDPGWEHAMTHEFIHVHHRAMMPGYCAGSSCYGGWVEEGLTEASTELVVRYALAGGIRDMTFFGYRPESSLPEYDVSTLAGVQFWGGAPVPARKVDAYFAYRMAAALFWLAGTSQQGAGGNVESADWARYDWFYRLTQAAYAWKRANPSSRMSHAQFYQIVDQVSPLPLDGQAVSAWIQAQPIAHYNNPAGNYMGIFPILPYGPPSIVVDPVSPIMVRLVFYTLDSADPANERLYTGQVNGSYAVYDHQDRQVESGTFSTTSGTSDLWSACVYGDGAYRVEAQADVGGTQRTAHTAYLCASQTITDAASGVGLILAQADGTLFDGSATSTGGWFRFNAGAGAILRPYNVERLPATAGVGFLPPAPTVEPSPPLSGTFLLHLPAVFQHWPPPDARFYNLPLPFSRVIVVTQPAE